MYHDIRRSSQNHFKNGARDLHTWHNIACVKFFSVLKTVRIRPSFKRLTNITIGVEGKCCTSSFIFANLVADFNGTIDDAQAINKWFSEDNS